MVKGLFHKFYRSLDFFKFITQLILHNPNFFYLEIKLPINFRVCQIAIHTRSLIHSIEIYTAGSTSLSMNSNFKAAIQSIFTSFLPKFNKFPITIWPHWKPLQS